MPRERRRASKPGFGPGKIYELFYRSRESEEQAGEERKDFEKFVDMCKQAARKHPYRGPVPRELRDALDFLGWGLEPEEVVAAARTYALYLAAAGVGLSIVLLYFMFSDYITFPPDPYIIQEYLISNPLFWIVLALPVLMGAGAYFTILSYPVSYAKSLFQNELLPALRVIENIVLSMKLVPNLEKAISFAVEHGEGFLAVFLRQAMWDVQLGMYSSVEEAIDRIAYRVGRFSDELKHALMRVRASLLEADDARRYVLLDSVLRETVSGIRNRLLDAASALQSPAIQLFYVGVFLPILLFIIVPVGAAFSSNALFANPLFLFGVFDVVLPIVVYYFSRSILSRRPQVYNVPVVPDSLIPGYASKKRAAVAQAVAVFVIGLALSYYLHVLFDPSLGKILYSAGVCNSPDTRACVESLSPEQIKYYTQGVDTTPYFLILGVLNSATLAAAFYLYSVSKDKIRVQKRIMVIEGEFKDAVYVIASRMGEGKPLENALDSVSDNMPEAEISGVFRRISYNVKNLGLTIYDAIFSPVFGVMREIPSELLRDAMRLLVAAVSLGTELASRALATISEQMRAEEEVIRRIREKTGEIAAMMLTMAYLVAPIVLGITVALEKVIMASMSNLSAAELPDVENLPSQLQMSASALEMISSAGKVQLPGWAFFIAVALYNIEITVLLVWFATYLHEGPNRDALFRKLAIAIVVSVALFSASAYISSNLVEGMLG